MLYMADPAMDGAPDILKADPSILIQSSHHSQPFSTAFDITLSDPHKSRVYPVAEKIHPFFRPEHPAFARMQPQPERFQVFGYPLPGFPEPILVIVEYHEVVTVADVVPATQGLLYKVVETVEVKVGKKLAGQIADGDSLFAGYGCKQVVSAKVLEGRFGRPMLGCDDLIHQPEGVTAFDFMPDLFAQDGVIDAEEILPDVTLQDETIFWQKLSIPGDSFVGAFTLDAGIGVVDKGFSDQRLDHIDQGVMDNAVPIRCGADPARFGVMDQKICVSTRGIGFGLQQADDAQQILLKVEFEQGRGAAKPFSPARFAGRP
jgi:hypothetical protein